MDGTWVDVSDRPDLLAPAYAFSADADPGSLYRPPDSCCALEIAVAPAHRGRGISVHAIDALLAATKRLALRELVAPVRPPGKIAEPFTPMEIYAGKTRDDGLVAVPGGLVPVIVSRDRDLGAYVEPNVWVRHRGAES
jgi:GNAT superfamily N-acetyltransferase